MTRRFRIEPFHCPDDWWWQTAPVPAGPLVDGEGVFAVEDRGRSALRLGHDGEVRWNVRLAEKPVRGNANLVALCRVDDVLVVAAQSHLVGLDVATGERRWALAHSAPQGMAAIDGSVVVGAGDRLVRVDVATGEAVWKAKVATSAPTVIGDRVIARCFGPYVSDPFGIGAWSLTDGKPSWCWPGGMPGESRGPRLDRHASPVSANGHAIEIVGETLLRFDPASQVPVYERPLDPIPRGATGYSALVLFGSLVVAHLEDTLFAWRAEDGTEAWRFHASGRIGDRPPFIHGERLFISDRDRLLAFDASGESEPVSLDGDCGLHGSLPITLQDGWTIAAGVVDTRNALVRLTALD